MHRPSRAERHENIEEHLLKATRLSRALWELAERLAEEEDEDDSRSLRGLAELAEEVSDHASTAEYLFSKGNYRASTKENSHEQ